MQQVIILSDSFCVPVTFHTQAADVQLWPAIVSPWCRHAQGEVRGRESYLHPKNVLLRNNRPPATVSGQTQVRPRPPVEVISLLASVFLSMWHWLLGFSYTTEAVVSLVMTSSARTRSAATMKTAGRSNRVDSWLMRLCCCERDNTLIHWLESIK